MFSSNRKRFAEKINNGIAILFSGDITHHPNSMKEVFRSDSNFYYLTGLDEVGYVAIVTANNYFLFAPAPDPMMSLWERKMPSFSEIKAQSGADEVFDIKTFDEKLDEYLLGRETLYYSLGCSSDIDKILLRKLTRLRKKSSQIVPYNIWDLNDVMQELRIIKSPGEIDRIRRAAEVTAAAYKAVFSYGKSDCFEYELEATLHHIYRTNGCDNAFPAIVGAGSNATTLHYNDNNMQIKAGDFVLVDSGAEYQHYCADVSRTWPINKKFTDSQRMIYQKLLDVQKNIIAKIKPGVVIDKWVNDIDYMLAECMVELGFLKGDISQIVERKEHKKYYPHSFGHWLGLDVHDVGNSYYRGKSRIFESGMVLTVEPGLYIQSDDENVPAEFRGMGLRIEDDILVTDSGHDVLTKDIPKEIDFFENL
ncbi:aminopeptidase P family protein [Candidatus Uabimicrobium sp. HlEnr_7]|uniref:aminopeptidase P family protein n=1 Tax=Candidatus Uabimicrobium helgolandensis TaxID=3095367 RepID=UPI0035568288